MNLKTSRLYYFLIFVFGIIVTIPCSLQAQQSTEIDGRAFVCSQSIEEYEVIFTSGNTYSWTLSGGGVIVGPSDTSIVSIQWTAGGDQGPFTITMTESNMMDTNVLTLDVNTERVIGLACNNDVFVSLDYSCELFLTADMILEDIMFDNDSYEIRIKDPVTKQLIPLGVTGEEYLNRPLEVTVEHLCSGNSCWGMVIFEDKSLPELFCTTDTINCNNSLLPDSLGFPVPDTITVTKIPGSVNSYVVETLDPCSDITLSYTDETVDYGCGDPEFSGVLLRTWIATDGDNGYTSCTDTIRARRALIDDLIMPTDMEISLVSCDGDFTKLENGAPSPEITGSPSGPACSNIYQYFDDVIVDLCGESFKVIREWTITDVCADEFRVYKQLIKVSDTLAPVILCPTDLTFSSDKYSCGSGVNIPLPVVQDCSPVTFEIFNKVYIENDDPLKGPYNKEFQIIGDSTFVIPALSEGKNWVVFEVTDECGNFSECAILVTIIDDIQPTPICDLHTVVALDEDGLAKVEFPSFDDGSWDNCSPIDIDIRRMTNSCSDTLWRDYVTFCCDDLGETQMVVLRVTDQEGNVDSCMVEVEVQDKLPPEIICPGDLTLDCSIDIWDLEPYGLPEITDNCDYTLTQDTIFDLNKCGFGMIQRIFTATDSSGNSSTCIQTLYLDNIDDPFTEEDIIWPQNYDLYDCAAEDLNPEDLPIEYAYPRFNEDPCAHVSFTYEDKFFAEADTACFLIVRTWWLIDACQWEHPDLDRDSTYGKWQWTHSLRVFNTTHPEFDDNCEDITLSGVGLENCTFDVEYIKTATDDCNSTLAYSFEIDLFDNDTIDRVGETNDASGIFPEGRHRVSWIVRDGCVNYTFCEQYLTIADTKPPTPYCIDGITTVLMPNTGAIEVWASDLNIGSVDNCTIQEDLIFAFSEDVNDNVRIYTCEDLDGTSLIDTVDIYVFDDAGNRDYCTTTLEIQDNVGCDSLVTAMVGGRIESTHGEVIQSVQVNLQGEDGIISKMTNESGLFSFVGIQHSVDYMLAMLKNDDTRNGISTLDLVLIQRHILGIQNFDDPYKIIAADINNSGNLTATDLLELRKTILGIYKEFPHNQSWRFINKNSEIIDQYNPFPFEEQVYIYNLQGQSMSNDFMGIKIGDVNGSVSLKSNKNTSVRDVSTITILDQQIEKGNSYTIRLNFEKIQSINGFQFKLSSSKEDLEFIGIDNTEEIENDNFFIDNGNITFSWASPIEKDLSAINIMIKAKKAGNLSDFLSIQNNFKNEAYIVRNEKEIKVKSLNLEFRSLENSEIYSLQSTITPNPFKDGTTIGFELQEDEKVEFKVYDLSGNLITNIYKPFKKGANEIQFYNDDRISGILIYTLKTKTLYESRKMILIE